MRPNPGPVWKGLPKDMHAQRHDSLGAIYVTIDSGSGGISLIRNLLSTYSEPDTVPGTEDKMAEELGRTLKTGKALTRCKEGRIETTI